jgi:hypothetical protein
MRKIINVATLVCYLWPWMIRSTGTLLGKQLILIQVTWGRKRRLIYLHPDLLVFTDLLIMSCGHILGIHVMSRGRRHISRGNKNVCNIMSLGYEIHILLLYYFKGNASKLVLKSLVHELPNCRCIASRTTYISVWRLLILINSLQEGDIEFIWSVCGPNELGLKRCIRTYLDDLISIYVHILCIFRRYKREQKIVFKTLKKRETLSKRETIQLLHDGSENERSPWENKKRSWHLGCGT